MSTLIAIVTTSRSGTTTHNATQHECRHAMGKATAAVILVALYLTALWINASSLFDIPLSEVFK